MPWKEVSAMSSRSEFVALARHSDANVARLARQFGVSRKTAYKWLDRFAAGGDAALDDRSRRPHTSPARSDDELEQAVLRLRGQHPTWGGRKLRVLLQRSGRACVPSASTITAILRRHGCLDGPRAGQARDWQRFEHAAPNDLWQMDFKGHFALNNGRRCHPLTVLDDHSRYAVGLVACGDEQTQTVRTALTELFRRYGLPRRMLMDNGSPWGSDWDHPYTPLTVWLLRLGVAVSHGRPYHPQTQGKDERFHRTLDTEVLSRQTFSDRGDCQRRLDCWREVYNQQRPHEALALEVPASRYRVSPRPLPSELPPLHYDAGDAVRKVQQRGVFSYRGRNYRVAKAFTGLPLGLRRGEPDGSTGVWFGTHCLGILDERQGLVQRRSRVDGDV
jgi:transposase InsO family protein